MKELGNKIPLLRRGGGVVVIARDCDPLRGSAWPMSKTADVLRFCGTDDRHGRSEKSADLFDFSLTHARKLGTKIILFWRGGVGLLSP